jgi:hypothetical protein
MRRWQPMLGGYLFVLITLGFSLNFFGNRGTFDLGCFKNFRMKEPPVPVFLNIFRTDFFSKSLKVLAIFRK